MNHVFITQPELSNLDNEILDKQKLLLSKYKIEFGDILEYADLLLDKIDEKYHWEFANSDVLSEINWYFKSNINLIIRDKFNYEFTSDVVLFWFDFDINTLQFKVGEFKGIIEMLFKRNKYEKRNNRNRTNN